MVGSEADREAVLRDAGAPAKLDGTDLYAIFRDAHVPEFVNDTRVALRAITAVVQTCKVAKVRNGRTPFEYPSPGGKLYTVQDVQQDGTGFSTLALTEAEGG